MIIRAMKKSDVPKLEQIYSESPAKYDIPLLDHLESAYVMVDEKDEPRMMVGAERTAEVFIVLDHHWETPAFRAAALSELGKTIRGNMESNGYRTAYAFMGPDVPLGFDRKLYRLGARKMVWRCVKFLREGK